MEKSPEAFRTISEVAEALEVPAHVLRFWESRFPQIRPVKRAGGRRYYRPADVALLTGIKRLLHDDGLTVRGVQKILREQGVRHVADFGGSDLHPHEDDIDAELVAAMDHEPQAAQAQLPGLRAVDAAQIMALQTALTRKTPILPTLQTASLTEQSMATGIPRTPADSPFFDLKDLAKALGALARPQPDTLRKGFAEQSARLQSLRDLLEARLQDAT